MHMETFVVLLIGFGVFGSFLAFLVKQCRHVVKHQEVLVVQKEGKATKVFRNTGTYWFQPFFSQTISKKNWAGRYKEHEIEIKGTARSWTFETYLWAFTQECLEAQMRVRLHLEMKDKEAPEESIYDLYEHLALICETATRDLISTVTLGKLRAERRNLQLAIKKEIEIDAVQLGVVVQKISISPSIRFDREVDEALKKETTTMLEKRAALAIEDHKNEVLVRAAKTEAQNRTSLADADAKNITQVAKALSNNTSEAARYIILMRFLHELSRLDPNMAKGNIHRPYLEILREFIKDIQPVTLEDSAVVMDSEQGQTN